MSHETSIAAWQADVSGSTLLVLVALAEWCNPKGICYPSMARIAHRANISERQAQRAVAELVKLGGLTVIKYGEGGRGKAPIYRLSPERMPQKPPFVSDWYEEHPGQGAPENAGKGDVGVTLSQKKGDVGVTLSRERVTPVVGKGDTHDVKGDIAMSPQPLLTTKNHQEDDEGEGRPVGEGGENGKAARRAPSAVPDRFEVSEEMRRQAESYGVPAGAIGFETEKFLDHFRQSGERKVDWPAAWRNWMRRVRDFGPRTPHDGSGPGSPGSVGRTAQAKSALDRMLELTGRDDR